MSSLMQGASALGQGIRRKRVGAAYRDAYMGDPQAMQELAGQDPQLASQLQNDIQKRKATSDQAGLKRQADLAKRRKSFVDEYRTTAGDISKFPTFEESQELGQREKNRLIRAYPEVTKLEGFSPEYTEQDFNEAKTIHSKSARQEEDTAGIKDFEYYQELKKTDPDSAEQFGRERGFISKEGLELSAHLQKRLSVAGDDAIKSEGNAGQYNALAEQIVGADISGGLFGGSWGEALKDVTGSQDAKTELRKKYNAIRGLNVVKNLPPGSASDIDVKMALAGFPTDNASGDNIASFLRGLAKLEQANADLNNFKAEYISEHGTERGLLADWKKTNKESQAEDKQALQWAKKNPEDPRAQKILELQKK